MYIIYDASLVVCLSEYLHFFYVRVVSIAQLTSAKRVAARLCLREGYFYNVFVAISPTRIKNQYFVLLHAPMIEYIRIICHLLHVPFAA